MGFTVKVVDGKRMYANVACDGCGKALLPVAPDTVTTDGLWRYLQPLDTLELQLVGGYGMAIDPIDVGPDDLRQLFCVDCTKELCRHWPSIAVLVKRECSDSIGHHCSRERRFVWRSLSDCCTVYCDCGRFGSCFVGVEDENDLYYSRRIIDCLYCGRRGPGKWAWEGDAEGMRKFAIELDEHDGRSCEIK